jgi:hypothetical protein
MPLQTDMRAAWGSAQNDPPGCTDCAQGWDRWMPYLARTWPDARISLLSALEDISICPGFGGALTSPQGCSQALGDFADTVTTPLSNARVFYVNEFNHVELKESLTGKVSAGISLGTFLTKQVTNDSTWTSARP